MVHQCDGCGLGIDPDETVVAVTRERPIYGPSIEPVSFESETKYAHVGHESTYVARGYRTRNSGRLRDLEAKRNPHLGLKISTGDDYSNSGRTPEDAERE